MATIHWDKVFAGEIPGKGATDAELHELAAGLGKPLTAEEIKAVTDPEANPSLAEHVRKTRHNPEDVRQWQLPTRPLPASYLSFLKWSNGGSFYKGKRGFNFLPTSMVRSFALSYHFPERMPGALPFAFDSGDDFYFFDMRNEPASGEYPILFARGENASFETAVHIADTFVEALQGQTDPATELKD